MSIKAYEHEPERAPPIPTPADFAKMTETQRMTFWEDAYSLPNGVLEAILSCPTPARIAEILSYLIANSGGSVEKLQEDEEAG